MLVKTDFVEL
jgi:hypothetical protein